MIGAVLLFGGCGATTAATPPTSTNSPVRQAPTSTPATPEPALALEDVGQSAPRSELEDLADELDRTDLVLEIVRIDDEMLRIEVQITNRGPNPATGLRLTVMPSPSGLRVGETEVSALDERSVAELGELLARQSRVLVIEADVSLCDVTFEAGHQGADPTPENATEVVLC